MADVPALGATNARARPRLCRRAGRRGPRLASGSLALAGRFERRSNLRAGDKAPGVPRVAETFRQWIAETRTDVDAFVALRYREGPRARISSSLVCAEPYRRFLPRPWPGRPFCRILRN